MKAYKFRLVLEVSSPQKLNKASRRSVGRMLAEIGAHDSWSLQCDKDHAMTTILKKITVKKW